jgi:hypothetical protein
MIRTLFRLLLSLALLMALSVVSGQEVTTDLDSIRVMKPKMRQSIYQFIDFGSKEIQIENEKAELIKDPETPKLNGFGSAAFTSLTGLNSSSKKEGYWIVDGLIHCNDTLPDWHVKLFCDGYIEKEREKVRNDDGSWSIETNEQKVFYWDNDPFGVILENIDTLGSFQINMKLTEDELLSRWDRFIFPAKSFSQTAGTKKSPWVITSFVMEKDFEIRGKFHEKDFVLIQTGSNHKVWIFIDESLAGMFQADNDNAGVTKKHRNAPYILINKEIPACDRRNIFRLAIMSRYVNDYVSIY